MSMMSMKTQCCGCIKDIREHNERGECKDKNNCITSVGYAKGNYMNKCVDCGEMTKRVDKNCYVCMSCAFNRLGKITQ